MSSEPSGRPGPGRSDQQIRALDAELGPLRALVNSAGVVDVASRVDAMTVARLKRTPQNTLSTAHTLKFICPFRLRPKWWMKAIAPTRRAALSTSCAPGQLANRLCAMDVKPCSSVITM